MCRKSYTSKNMETLENIPWKAQNELFQKLEELSKVAAMTPEQRAEYDETLRQYRDNLAVRSAAIKEGERRGKRKGKSQALHLCALHIRRASLSCHSMRSKRRRAFWRFHALILFQAQLCQRYRYS